MDAPDPIAAWVAAAAQAFPAGSVTFKASTAPRTKLTGQDKKACAAHRKKNACVTNKDASCTNLPDTPASREDFRSIRAVVSTRPYWAMQHVFNDASIKRYLFAAYVKGDPSYSVVDQVVTAIDSSAEIFLNMRPDLVPFGDGMKRLAHVMRIHNRDRFGRPVLMLKLGEFKPREVGADLALQGIAFVCYQAINQMPPGVTKFVMVLDARGLSSENFDKALAVRVVQFLDLFAAGRLAQAYIVYVQWIVWTHVHRPSLFLVPLFFLFCLLSLSLFSFFSFSLSCVSLCLPST
jgi:hypothetical protein